MHVFIENKKNMLMFPFLFVFNPITYEKIIYIFPTCIHDIVITLNTCR